MAFFETVLYTTEKPAARERFGVELEEVSQDFLKRKLGQASIGMTHFWSHEKVHSDISPRDAIKLSKRPEHMSTYDLVVVLPVVAGGQHYILEF